MVGGCPQRKIHIATPKVHAVLVVVEDVEVRLDQALFFRGKPEVEDSAGAELDDLVHLSWVAVVGAHLVEEDFSDGVSCLAGRRCCLVGHQHCIDGR